MASANNEESVGEPSCGKAGENSLSGAWLLDWAWGFLKSPSLQRYAKHALMSGFTNELMQKLAGLGSNGLYVGNIHTELVNLACKADVLPKNHILVLL